MSWDIYGEVLERGHCEVHPWVGEEYPCSLCIMERKNRDRQDIIMREQQQQQQKEYEEYLERERVKSLHIYERDPDLLTDKRY